MRAAIYCRSARAESLDEVIAWGIEYIENHPEYEVADLYSEVGSGLQINPELNKILDLAEQNHYDVVVTRDITRVSRNTVLFMETKRRLNDCNTELVIDDEYDTKIIDMVENI